MEMGLIAEGPADIAVLRNILKGWLGLQKYQVRDLRPDLQSDETDMAMNPGQQSVLRHSNWELVLESCKEGSLIRNWLAAPAEGDRRVVIQIDTDTVEHKNFGLTRPSRKSRTYVLDLRNLVVEYLTQCLMGSTEDALFAVTVEETDAWVLLLHSDVKDSGSLPNPKGKLDHAVRGLKLPHDVYRRYDELSGGFRKRKTLAEVLKRNASLAAFLESIPVSAVDNQP